MNESKGSQLVEKIKSSYDLIFLEFYKNIFINNDEIKNIIENILNFIQKI